MGLSRKRLKPLMALETSILEDPTCQLIEFVFWKPFLNAKSEDWIGTSFLSGNKQAAQ
jgi:hypothetical protein